jgi:hypothetical protein
MHSNASLSDSQKQLLPLTPAVFFILRALADGEKDVCSIVLAAANTAPGQTPSYERRSTDPNDREPSAEYVIELLKSPA